MTSLAEPYVCGSPRPTCALLPRARPWTAAPPPRRGPSAGGGQGNGSQGPTGFFLPSLPPRLPPAGSGTTATSESASLCALRSCRQRRAAPWAAGGRTGHSCPVSRFSPPWVSRCLQYLGIRFPSPCLFELSPGVTGCSLIALGPLETNQPLRTLLAKRQRGCGGELGRDDVQKPLLRPGTEASASPRASRAGTPRLGW